jgi:arylsulfatase
VLLAEGGRFGGYSFYVQGGHLRYVYNFLGHQRFHIASDAQLPPGPHTLAFSFERTGDRPFGAGGIGRLYVDGTQAGQGEIARTVPFILALGQGLQCGADEGTPVTEEYASPFRFTGTLLRVVVDLSGPEPPRDLDQEARIDLTRD